MAHVELPSRGDELTAVPKRGGGLNRKEIRSSGNGKHQPAYQRIPQFEILHNV